MASARELLLNQGVHRFSVEEVARTSGVAKSTIYRHFSSGEALLIAAVDSFLGPTPTPDTGNVRSDLAVLIEGVVTALADIEVRRLVLGLLALSASNPQLATLQQSFIAARRAPLLDILGRAKERGELPSGLDPLVACDFIEGPFAVHWLLEPGSFDQVEVASYVDRILVALGG